MFNLKVVISFVSLMLFLVVLELIRREKLKERYALLWLFTCLGIFLFSFSPKLINFISEVTGMYYLSIISMFAYLFVLLMLLHFSIVLSKLHERNKMLTQQLALLRDKVERIKQKND